MLPFDGPPQQPQGVEIMSQRLSDHESTGRDSRLQWRAVHEVSHIEADQFLATYVAENRPLIVRSAARDWPALTRWDDDYLRRRLGHCEVPVETSVDQFEGRVFGDVEEIRLTFGEFLDRMTTDEGRYDYFVGHWLRPELQSDVGGHPLLDAMNQSPRYRMIMTRGGNRIAFHFDRYQNILVQIDGTKRVVLCAPIESRNLEALDSPSNYSHLDIQDVDLKQFPKAGEILFYDVTLEPGDLLYIPTLWWHTVQSFGRNIMISSAFIHRWEAVLGVLRRWVTSDEHHGLSEGDKQALRLLLKGDPSLSSVTDFARRHNHKDLLRLVQRRPHLHLEASPP